MTKDELHNLAKEQNNVAGAKQPAAGTEVLVAKNIKILPVSDKDIPKKP